MLCLRLVPFLFFKISIPNPTVLVILKGLTFEIYNLHRCNFRLSSAIQSTHSKEVEKLF